MEVVEDERGGLYSRDECDMDISFGIVSCDLDQSHCLHRSLLIHTCRRNPPFVTAHSQLLLASFRDSLFPTLQAQYCQGYINSINT